MIQFHVGRPGPVANNDWRANPYLCGMTDERTYHKPASRTIDLFDDDDDNYDDVPF